MENKISYTAGDWETKNVGNDILIGLNNDPYHPDCIGTVIAKTIGNSEVCKANARLLKLAPRLLEMLELLLSDDGPIVGDGWENPWVKDAQGLVDLANGEKSDWLSGR